MTGIPLVALVLATVLLLVGSVAGSSYHRKNYAGTLTQSRVKRGGGGVDLVTDLTFTTGINYITVSWANNLFPTGTNVTFRLIGPGLQAAIFYNIPAPSFEGSHIFPELLSSSLYRMRVTLIRANASTTTKNYTIATKPEAPQSVSGSTINTTIITIRWTNGGFTLPDNYRVTYRNTQDPSQGDSLMTDVPNLSITNLLPGRNYSIEVVSLKNGEESNKAQVYMVTAPLPPVITDLVASGTQQLLLTWSPDPSSLQSNYEISYSILMGGRRVVVPSCGRPGPLRCLIDVSAADRSAGQTFRIYIVALQGAVRSDAAAISGNTKPETPVITKLESLGPQSVRLQWDTQPRSIQNSFEISYTVSGSAAPKTIITGCRLSSPFECIIDLSPANQDPGQKYRMSIIGIAGGSRSEEASAEVHTKPLRPSLTKLVASGMQSLFVSWNPANNSIQSSYEIYYEVTGHTNTRQVVSACSSPEIVSCTIDVSPANRNPGQSFTVGIIAVQFQSRSDPAKGQTNTIPRSVQGIRRREHTSSSIVIEWPEPEATVLSGFQITVTPEHGRVTEPTPSSNKQWSAIITGLQAGTQYKVTVATLSGQEIGASSRVTLYTKPTVPGMPVRESTSVSSLSVKWSAPATGQFEKYRVQIRVSDTNQPPQGVSTPQIISREDNVASFSGLIPGTEYRILVESAVGIDIYSRANSAKFYTRPLSVESIQLSDRTETSFGITWIAPRDSGFTGFTVRLREVGNSLKRISAGSALEAVFGGLKAGTRYTVEVITLAGDQSSIQTSQIYGTMPYSPENLRITGVTNSSVTFEWESIGTLDGFQFTIQSDGQGFTRSVNINDRNAKTYTVRGLLAGGVYSLTMVSRSGSVQSRQVRKNNIETKPNQPRNLQILEKGTSVLNISWFAPPSSGVDSYYIVISHQGRQADFSTKEIQGPRFQRFTDLEAGATYKIQIFAMKGDTRGEALQGMLTMKPNLPQNFRILFVGVTSLQLSWEDPVRGVYDGFLIKYRVLPTGRYLSKSLAKDSQTQEVIGLMAGTPYFVSLTTRSGNETSAPSELTTTTQPASVTTLEIARVGMTTVTVQWLPPDNTGVDSYKLYINRIGNFDARTEEVEKGRPRSVTFDKLVPGAAYNVSITVLVADKVSLTASRVFNTRPMPIEYVKAETLGTTRVKLTWATSRTSVQNEFKVFYQRGGLPAIESDTIPANQDLTVYETEISRLDPGYTYLFSITPMSQKVSGQTGVGNATTVPKAVEELSATALRSDAMEIAWTPPGDSYYDRIRIDYKGTLKQASLEWLSVTVTASPHILRGLIPGELYQIQLATVSANQVSSVRTTTVVLFPLPPSSVIVDRPKTTASSILLVWEHDIESGYILRWRIVYNIQELATEIKRTVDGAYASSAEITGLQSGQTYSFRVYGVTVNDITSQMFVSTNATVKPVCDTTIFEDKDATDNATVAIRYSPNSGVYDGFRFTCNTKPPMEIRKRMTDPDRRVVFKGKLVEAGTTYTVSVQTHSKDEVSAEKKNIQVTTHPNPANIEILPGPSGGRSGEGAGSSSGETELPDPNSITIRLNNGGGNVDRFIVRGLNYPGNHTQVIEVEGRGPFEATFRNLEPNTNYSFTVVAEKGDKRSREQILTIPTGEGAPGPVQELEVFENLPEEVRLEWREPKVINGILRGYIIRYTADRMGKGNKYPSKSGGEQTNSTSITFRNLAPGYVYRYEVRAKTVREGDIRTRTVTVPALRPKLNMSLEDSKPVALGGTETTITYQFVNPFIPFEDFNRDIEGYTVIVSTNSSYNGPLQKWNDENVVAYETFPICAEFFSPDAKCGEASRQKRQIQGSGGPPKVNFTVGGNDCDPSAAYCNVNLKPGKTYFVKLQAANDQGDTSGTPFSAPYSTVAITTTELPTTTIPTPETTTPPKKKKVPTATLR